MKLSLIAGARPNFMKIAPLARALKQRQVSHRIVHTGQHYDQKMSETFFEELEIPQPDVNLEVGSGQAIWQVTEVMRRLETEFEAHRPDAVVVVGDVNSTLAAALTATKMDLPLAHVEAGLRSFDRTMPEEGNRIVTDALSAWLFTSEPSGDKNLVHEGVSEDKIFLVGNVMIDTLLANLSRARQKQTHQELGLEARQFVLVTLHRPSNVDNPDRFESILKALRDIAKKMPVVLPIHPRTRGKIDEFGFRDGNLAGLQLVEPLGYHDMLNLIDSARLVLTDSGGIQEETTALEVPCLTLRENTERPITVEVGSNQLVGWKTDDILLPAHTILSGSVPQGRVPENWDGHAAERIVDILLA
ncbi:MAG: UDP-N-acetylglucosamine 2-epimerase (non-hydrolyzing) [Planctomycetales bacterium]